MAANFRRLFALQYNQWAKQGHQMKEWSLWPLSIDKTEIDEQEAEEMYKRNREIERQILERRNQNNLK